MSSKKYHRDPQYHKLRDISRQSTSAKSSVRKRFRAEKAETHRRLRKSVQMKLREAAKSYTADDSINDDYKVDLTPDFPQINRFLRYAFWAVSLKHGRWDFDALNPCLRWADSIKARAGEIKIRRLFGAMDRVSISHLKSHVFEREDDQKKLKWASRTAQALAREFDTRGLSAVSNPHNQLVEIARQASIYGTEAVLTAWTKYLTEFLYYNDGRLWLRKEDRYRTADWWLVEREPHRRKTNTGLVISGSWCIWDEYFYAAVMLNHPSRKIGWLMISGDSPYWSWEERYTVTEFAMPIQQLGRAINKYESHLTDRSRKRTFKIALTKNVDKDSPCPWTLTGDKGVIFDYSHNGPIWRPLNGYEDSEAWATDIRLFLQNFYDRELFETAYWRWIVCELLAAVMSPATR